MIRIVEDVAGEAAAIIAAARGHVALSGGSTPKEAYAQAAGGLSNVTLWLGDERVVGADDERSNYRMAREQFGPDAPIERVRTELGMTAAAGDYEARLRAAVDVLDLAIMGLGPDGHTASLFPGKPALAERERWVVEVPEAGMDPQVPRVTMTFPVFNAARRVVFLVEGEGKAVAMRRAFGDPPDPSVPSAHIRPAGELLVLCDAAAASQL